MKLPNKLYDVLKWVCLIALPALAVFYAVIAKIWGLPYEAEIPATINAVAVLIGALIGVSHLSIKKGEQDDYIE
jgi:hypothetical protein